MKTSIHHFTQLIALAALCSLLLNACATTPASDDPTAPAIAAAKSFQQALVQQNFADALALVADDFTSPAWHTRDDLRFYLDQARDRGYFLPATVAAEAPKATIAGDTVRVYPVGIRSRAGVAVFDLTLAPRGAAWKIVSATVEFY